MDLDLLEFLEEIDKETKVGQKINDPLAKLVNNTIAKDTNDNKFQGLPEKYNRLENIKG